MAVMVIIFGSIVGWAAVLSALTFGAGAAFGVFALITAVYIFITAARTPSGAETLAK